MESMIAIILAGVRAGAGSRVSEWSHSYIFRLYEIIGRQGMLINHILAYCFGSPLDFSLVAWRS